MAARRLTHQVLLGDALRAERLGIRAAKFRLKTELEHLLWSAVLRDFRRSRRPYKFMLAAFDTLPADCRARMWGHLPYDARMMFLTARAQARRAAASMADV